MKKPEDFKEYQAQLQKRPLSLLLSGFNRDLLKDAVIVYAGWAMLIAVLNEKTSVIDRSFIQVSLILALPLWGLLKGIIHFLVLSRHETGHKK